MKKSWNDCIVVGSAFAVLVAAGISAYFGEEQYQWSEADRNIVMGCLVVSGMLVALTWHNLKNE